MILIVKLNTAKTARIPISQQQIIRFQHLQHLLIMVGTPVKEDNQ